MKFYAQILLKLQAKHPGLRKALLETFAKKLAAKVTEEDKIDAAIADLDNLPITLPELDAELQREGDKRVTEASKKDPKKGKKKGAKDEDDDDDTDDDDLDVKDPKEGDPNQSITQMLKLMHKQQKALADEIKGLKTEKTQQTFAEKLKAQLTEKKIPHHLVKNVKVESEADLLAAVTDAEVAWTEIKQQFNDVKLDGQQSPTGGIPGSKATGKEDADIAAWAKNTAPAKKETATA